MRILPFCLIFFYFTLFFFLSLRNVFTLDHCNAVVGSEVICFDKRKEGEMLQVSFLVPLVKNRHTHTSMLTHAHTLTGVEHFRPGGRP